MNLTEFDKFRLLGSFNGCQSGLAPFMIDNSRSLNLRKWMRQ